MDEVCGIHLFSGECDESCFSYHLPELGRWYERDVEDEILDECDESDINDELGYYDDSLETGDLCMCGDCTHS